MSQTRNLVILLALLLAGTLAEEDPEPIFKAVGGELEMGFCFGEYIAVYRITAEGRQLLGESSNPVSPPEAFKGRINISDQVEGLLGLKIMNLKFSDSGIYTRECKSGDIIENYRKNYLYVCGEEIRPQEISLTPGTGADLVCNINASKLSHTTVKWYRDTHKASLFLDTKISLEPLKEDFRGLVQVHDKGSSLHVSDDLIKDRPNFVCQNMEGEQCLSFQTLGLPEEPDIKSIYRSVGEDMVLTCSVDHLRKNYWETPFGKVNSSEPVSFKEKTGNQMFVLNDMNIGNYSLVIQSLTLENIGNYKCISTFLVEEYIVNVCPVHESTDMLFSAEDKKVVLTCRFISVLPLTGNNDFPSILWFRKNGEKDTPIMDSGDPSLPTPEDLMGRVTLLEKDSSLVITSPKEEDSGTYWCVVLLDGENSASADDDSNDDPSYSDNNQEEEDEEEDEEIHDQWITEEEYMDMCLFRQVTNLRFQSNTIKTKTIDIKSQPGDTPEPKPEPKPEPTPEPKPEPHLIIYAVCGGLVVLLVLGLIGIVVGMKMRAKKTATSNQRGGLELSEEGRALRSNSNR